MANGWATEMRWPATLAGNWDFIGPDGTSKYRWKSGSRVSLEFTCASCRVWAPRALMLVGEADPDVAQ